MSKRITSQLTATTKNVARYFKRYKYKNEN
jgi:hypothetical protein